MDEAGSSSSATAGRKRKRTDNVSSTRSAKRRTVPSLGGNENGECSGSETESDNGVLEPRRRALNVSSTLTSISTPSGSIPSAPLSPSPFPELGGILPTASTSTIGTISTASSFSSSILPRPNQRKRTPTPTPTPDPAPAPERRTSDAPLSEYTCPICFSPPTNAAITPCGHICCGACLFTAVKTTLHRGAMTYSREPNVARCPVCRAPIPGWDGRGGGVVGLRPRVVITL